MDSSSLVYEGSVKDIHKNNDAEELVFYFSDRFSVFDWGAMPDVIADKGKALSYLGHFFFEYFSRPDTWKSWDPPEWVKKDPEAWTLYRRWCVDGVPHHLVGVKTDNQSFDTEYGWPHESEGRVGLVVKKVEVTPPILEKESKKETYDYSYYKKQPVNQLVPLEVIFRFGLPPGSSLIKRLDANKLRELNLDKLPKEGDKFKRPIVEFSTKLEATDRYLDLNEAKEIAGLRSEELRVLKSYTCLLAAKTKDLLADLGIDLWDGKFEFAFMKGADGNQERTFMLVDSLGPDEIRAMRGGVHISKEFLRQFYRNTTWFQQIEKAKKLANERGKQSWKGICEKELGAVPPQLATEILQNASSIYTTLCNDLAQHENKRPPFKSKFQNIKSLVKDLNGEAK